MQEKFNLLDLGYFAVLKQQKLGEFMTTIQEIKIKLYLQTLHLCLPMDSDVVDDDDILFIKGVLYCFFFVLVVNAIFGTDDFCNYVFYILFFLLWTSILVCPFDIL